MDCPRKIYDIDCYKKYGIERGQPMNAIRGRIWEINQSKLLNMGDHSCGDQSPVCDSSIGQNDCNTTNRSDDCYTTIYLNHCNPPDQSDDCKPYDCKPYDCKPYDCKPYDCKPYDCKPYDCKPYDCNPYDCNPSDHQNDYCGECNKKNCCDECEPSDCCDDPSECCNDPSDCCDEPLDCFDDEPSSCCDDGDTCDVKCNGTCKYIKLRINSAGVLTILLERLMNILKGVKNNMGVLKLILLKINSAPLSSTDSAYLNTRYMSVYRSTVRLLDYEQNNCHFFKTRIVVECCLFNRHLKDLSEYKSFCIPSLIINPIISGHPFEYDHNGTIDVLDRLINRTKKIIRLLWADKPTNPSHKT